MLSLLCLAAASLVSNVGPCSNIDDNYLSIPLVEFMSSNFDTFVNKYNEYHEDKLIATALIRTRDLILQEEEKGYFFDFDYGFMVASEDYKIYLISNYDLPYENDLFLTKSDLYFKGSSFYNEEGYEYGVVNNLIASGDTLESVSDPTDLKNTDGKIDNSKISEYISTNYPGFNIVSENYIKNYDYIDQADTSVYVKPIDSDWFQTEGNCVINSTYSMLHNLGKKNMDRKFYHKDYYVNYGGEKVTHDAHYYLVNNGWVVNKTRRAGNPKNGMVRIETMSDLYLRLRERAISSYGYTETIGMFFNDAKNMAMDVDGWYGYNTTFFETGDFNTMKQLVDSEIPSLVSTNNSIIYKNHSMAVNGYIKLKKTSGWWIFSSTETKWILSVDDGHQDSCVSGNEDKRKFYDPNKRGGAQFICADKSTLDYSLC